MGKLIAVLMVGFVVAGCSSGPDMSWVSQDAQHSLEQRLGEHVVGAQVRDLDLVKATDSEYKGIADVRTPWGGVYSVPVEITIDGKKYMMQIPPGGVFQLLQDARSHGANVG